jgi:Cytochrome P450
MAYFHAMYLFPEIAKNVYEEIVEVTGGTRLPTSADRPALRYTEAVWKEAFRWNSFVPLVRTTRFTHNISSIDHVPRPYLTSI